MATTHDFETLLVPLQLDAFVLNKAVCGTGNEGDTSAHICPITQPNYTFLRLENFLIQSDIQNHADLHNTAPAEVNSRMTDLGARPTPQPLRHRYGVYVHWTLPRFYRSGVATSETVPEVSRRQERLRRGLKSTPSGTEQPALTTPDFVQPPTRWVVVRRIYIDSIQPETAKPAFASREYEAWVVESDHLWSLDEIPLDVDLQTDVAPFVTGKSGADVNIEEQAEVFIGRKTPLAKWTPDDPNSDVQPPNISLLRSGNQLFADFQMHNSNVFSILDNFEYADESGKPQYLAHAKASYYLLGWHWKEDTDPLWNSTKSTTHGASLESLFMKMKGADENPDDWSNWLNDTSQLRALCHGAMYDVVWDEDNKPAIMPADEYNARINDPKQAAVSVGTTPMDALISYCHARKGEGYIDKLEEDILALESLLLSRDDGVEAQREAKNTIYNWSFNRSSGGLHYHFSGGGKPGEQPVEPERPAVLKLSELNQTQSLLDSCTTTMKQYRWDMFSLWWGFMSDVGNGEGSSNETETGKYQTKVNNLAHDIGNLQSRIDQLQKKITDLLNPQDKSQNLLETAKAASKPVFYRANDPTVLIGGIPSGWPIDYLDKVAVRAPAQTIPANNTSNLPVALKDLSDLLKKKLPDILRAPVSSLVTEFYIIQQYDSSSNEPPAGTFYPQFHDPNTAVSDGSLRDQWGNRQPWFPLYVEWETEYTHIPFNYWKLDEHTARLSANEMVRYGITVPSTDGHEPPPLWEALLDEQKSNGPDTRVLSGRVLILPQPSFSLGAKIAQLFDNTPPDILDRYLLKEERERLRENVSKLSYLSMPLSGFTNGIITLAEGSHIKPENKTIDSGVESSEAISAAINDQAGLSKEHIELIKGESASTPYVALANFLDSAWCPFKPVTHGQFRFRKLNIIDKFGQALVPIDQNPQVNGPPPLYPCISDFYEPQTIKVDGKDHANTVIKDNPAQCEFLQLPPQINQNARLNANFVQRISDDPEDEKKVFGALGTLSNDSPESATWRPASEWETPIWGWVITNYADYGIQLFLADGTFYREVRFGGPLGTLDAPKWLPFSPNKDTSNTDTRQLDALVNKLVDRDYLHGFWTMITKAQDTLPAAPNDYAQFLNSIVGKPLALVNTGWSLELDSRPLKNQSSRSKVTDPERDLTKSTDDKDYYQFQVRLGDRDATYDGLVGYFDTTAPGTDELNLDYIRTFFAPDDKEIVPLKPLNTNEYPLFTPFWEPPFKVEPADFDNHRNARMSVFGAIIDPFTPIHAYSSFLPPSELLLPSWTWQKAMNTMTAFFHAGPLTLPLSDVPPYDPSQVLTTDNATDIPKRDLPLPSLGAGDWSWFQPYSDNGNEDGEPTFNYFGIEKRGDLTKPGFQDAPYTAVEGFLQLRNPIMTPK